jgi:hypothetical protein
MDNSINELEQSLRIEAEKVGIGHITLSSAMID